jgi:hypothetical protein
VRTFLAPIPNTQEFDPFSRISILSVINGNRIALMAVLDKPTKSLAQSGLKQDVPIRMEQSVVEKLLTGPGRKT